MLADRNLVNNTTTTMTGKAVKLFMATGTDGRYETLGVRSVYISLELPSGDSYTLFKKTPEYDLFTSHTTRVPEHAPRDNSATQHFTLPAESTPLYDW